MTTNDFLQTGLFLLVLLLLVKPVGSYMTLVFAEAPNRITRFGGRAERADLAGDGQPAPDQLDDLAVAGVDLAA